MNSNIDNSVENQPETQLTFRENLIALAVISVVSLISNWAGTGIDPIKTLPAMLIIYVMVIFGLILAKLIPIGFPAVAWVSLVSVLVTIPISPVSEIILTELKNISFLAMVTPILAYAALAITKMEVDLFKRSGFKIAIISILVFTGTYVGSVMVANALLGV
ncbi:hypothetical protein [Marinomonas posidonica]|uniref:Uncharacterized protein n=1 Tax=Marinomonas posidonica (strain CECT 7376 / NCIMB 14433 / IVIA-Po-181) TaxID=491952 RepID=F6CV52_MARPP|nr:hypothetical protein [Marinomonas posidonica]AEF56472.1 hypothetical protein Mar181_3456 [Marinomonas posidonica IVIA-Po-181]